MCLYQRQELCTLSQAQAKLKAEGLKPGTPEWHKEANRFVDTDMLDNETGEPLLYECVESDAKKQLHGEESTTQVAVAGV
jgi:hypothetical protein